MDKAKPFLGLDDRSRMSREAHVRFCESVGVRFPHATRRVPRRHGKEVIPEVPCCTRDEGGPFGTGVQALVPNHLKLRWSRARVGSVQEKARRTRQVRVKETSGSEPLMTCRNCRDGVKTGRVLLAQEKPGRNLFTGQAASGIKVA